MLGGGSIADHLGDLVLYINKIDLKPGKELQLITKNKGKYLLL
jgi:hypothetical protein